MSKYYGPKAVPICKDGKILRKPRITMATVGPIQLDIEDVHLKAWVPKSKRMRRLF